MSEKPPESVYWEDPEGAQHYEEDTAAATTGDKIPTEEEKRLQSGHAQRSADADAERAEGLLEAEVGDLYAKLKEEGVIPVNDTDDEGYSDYYNRLSKFVRYGDVPSWDWERLDSEHAIATEEEKEHAQALKSFYAVLTTSDEPQE